MDEIEFWVSGEWTMVYLNGELVTYGDSYHADEWLQERCGVVTVNDDASSSVPDGHNPIRSLAEVRAAEAERETLKREAFKKRAEAAQLIAEAEKLEGKS